MGYQKLDVHGQNQHQCTDKTLADNEVLWVGRVGLFRRDKKEHLRELVD